MQTESDNQAIFDLVGSVIDSALQQPLPESLTLMIQPLLPTDHIKMTCVCVPWKEVSG